MQNVQKTCLRNITIPIRKKTPTNQPINNNNNNNKIYFNMKVEYTNWSVLITTDTLQLWMLLPVTDASCASLWRVWTPHVVLVCFSGSSCCIQSVILAIVNSWCPFFLLTEFGTHFTRSGVRGVYAIAATEEGFLVEVWVLEVLHHLEAFLFLTIVISALLKWTFLSISRHLATATDGQEHK